MAGTSSAFSVYLVAAGFRPPLARPETFDRHVGDRLWINLADVAVAGTVPNLVDRLSEARGLDPDVVFSGEVEITAPGIKRVDPPRDRAADTHRFVSQHAPSVALFLGLDVCPAVLYGLRMAGLRTMLVASPTGTSTNAASRFLAKPMFRLFDEIAATNDATRAELIKLGATPGRISVVGRLDDGAPAPATDEARQEKIASVLSGRPLWLAAHLTSGEIRSVLDAQREVNGHSHRMLLVIAPKNPRDAEGMAHAAEVRGYEVARASKGEEPGESVQVYFADEPDDIGMWYRLAPITFMGNSLENTGGDTRPDGPAALGSAILFGPEIGTHKPDFDRLASIGGARLVPSGEALGAAVSGLLAPDKPAAMAHAAWLETSKGAEGTDRVVDLLVQAFDDPEGF